MKHGIAMGLASTVMLAGCSGETKPEPPSPKEQANACVDAAYESLTSEQVQTGRHMARAAISLAERVDIGDVTQVANFIRTDVGHNPTEDPDPLAKLIPVDMAAPNDCAPLEYFRQQGAFGFFDHDTENIYIADNSESVSDLAAGMIMLHESKHAYDFSVQEYPDPMEERETRLFEQHILNEAGGATYRSYLDDIRIRIIEAGFDQEHKFSINPSEVVSSLTQRELEQVFGPLKGEQDVRILSSAVFIQAVFELLASVAPKQDIAWAQQDFLDRSREAASIPPK